MQLWPALLGKSSIKLHWILMHPAKATLNRMGLCLLLAIAINLSAPAQGQEKAKSNSLHNQPAVIWIDP
ncbi:MAG TPA: hypothetical protein VFP71_08615, partial [Candidatus Angelobacter sp.]|nr:hypothetical protein [Candidatus Angelobacter sp.]